MPRNAGNGDDSLRMGATMKKQRLALKLSQKQVGDELGVSQAMIAKYEQGLHDLPANKLRGLHRLQFDVFAILDFVPSIPDLPDWAVAIARNMSRMNQQEREHLIYLIGALADARGTITP